MTARGNFPDRPKMFDLSWLFRRYAQARVRKVNREDAESRQRRTLLKLVAQAKDTSFGRAHNFGAIDSIDAFQRNVPLRDYRALWDEWWQPTFPDLENCTWPGRIPFFSLTSGTTTGRSKQIPYTYAMRRAAARGFVDLLCWHFVNRPQSRLLGGAALGLTGPTRLDAAGTASEAGAVSAITLGVAPRLLRNRILPPPELADIADWDEKIRRLSQLALRSDIRMLGGSPNWLLIFLSEVARAADTGTTISEWFPNLELIVHGGLNFAPYRERIQSLLSGGHAETREMYSASEGVFALADREDGEGMRLHLDGEIFFEFVPVSELMTAVPKRYWIGTAECGVDYAFILTSAAGLWAYALGDSVRFVSLTPPRLLVTGRIGHMLSGFGEHVIESEIATAIAKASRHTSCNVQDYCVSTHHETAGGRHVFFVEARPALNTEKRARFSEILDQSISEQNDDYAELREGNLSLKAPEVHFLLEGAFADWMKDRRALGGQNKVPRIVNDPDLFRDLSDFLSRYEMGPMQ